MNNDVDTAILNNLVEHGGPMIFTNGAFVSPIKIDTGEGKRWCWVVESFEDDSFYDGEHCWPKEWCEEDGELFENVVWN